jgi:hypothetical protein
VTVVPLKLLLQSTSQVLLHSQEFTSVIPVTGEVEMGRNAILGQLWQKVRETLISTNKLGVVYTCHRSYVGDKHSRMVV